jgi:hypothetical protein
MERKRPDAKNLRDDTRSAAILAEAERRHRTRFPDYDPRWDECPPRRPFRRRFPRLLNRILLFAVLILLLLIVVYKIGDMIASRFDIDMPETLSAFLPDETMGYSQIDFSNAILGESRAKSDFVVLEQDVTVTSRVSQALANLALFEKSQVIRSYGTGVYTVDLSALTQSDIAVDEKLQQVTVTIPHAALAYVTVDVEKTEYEDTKKALFAFGDIKLTNEQLNLLEQSIDEAMCVQLESTDMLAKADAHALSQVQKLFEPIVQSVAADYIVSITLQQTQ